MTDNENSPQETIEPDDTFTAMLDDCLKEASQGWDVTQELENIIAYHRGALGAREAQLEIAHAEIERLKATIVNLEAIVITPEMLTVWADWQTIKANAISEISASRQSVGLRSDLWHAFNAMMEGDK